MKQVFVLVLACMITGIAAAQKTNFSGTWNYDNQESVSGNLYSNGSPSSIVAKQSDTAINLEFVTAGRDGNEKLSYQIGFGGRPLQSSSVNKEAMRTYTLTWNGDKSFTIVALTYKVATPDKFEFKTTDTYILEDGQLVLQRKAENGRNGEVWESKAYYFKK